MVMMQADEMDMNAGPESVSAHGAKEKDGLTAYREVGNLLQRPGERAEEEQDQRDHSPDDRTGHMLRDSVERNGEDQDMATSGKDQQDHQSRSENLTPESAHDNLAGICDIHHVGVRHAKLPNSVASIGRYDTEADDHDHAGYDSDGGEH